MKKIIISSSLIFIFGCAFLSEKNIYDPLKQNELSFLYEGNKQIIFSIPDGGINILSPATPSYSSFTSFDIDASDQDLIWLANITFELRENMISGKYSIRLAAASINEQYDTELIDAKSLASYQVYFYKNEYGINREFHIVQAGNYSWVTYKSVNRNQVVVSAFLALDNRHYLVFSFEYFGYDQKEIDKLQRSVNSTLGSFTLKNI